MMQVKQTMQSKIQSKSCNEKCIIMQCSWKIETIKMIAAIEGPNKSLLIIKSWLPSKRQRQKLRQLLPNQRHLLNQRLVLLLEPCLSLERLLHQKTIIFYFLYIRLLCFAFLFYIRYLEARSNWSVQEVAQQIDLWYEEGPHRWRRQEVRRRFEKAEGWQGVNVGKVCRRQPTWMAWRAFSSAWVCGDRKYWVSDSWAEFFSAQAWVRPLPPEGRWRICSYWGGKVRVGPAPKPGMGCRRRKVVLLHRPMQ